MQLWRELNSSNAAFLTLKINPNSKLNFAEVFMRQE